MYNRNGAGSKPPPDDKDQELTEEEVRWIRGWANTWDHLRWLWRTIFRPVGIAAIATLAGAPAVISGLKEIIKWLGGK